MRKYRAYNVLRHLTAVMCLWEAFAIELDKDYTPTFSKLCGDYPKLAPVLLIALGIHLMWPMGRKS